MPRWPHDDPASLAAFYGDPDRGEPGKQLVAVVPPFKMYYAGKPVPHIMFHKKAADALAAALNEIWEAYGRSQLAIDKQRISSYSGAYNPRKIRGSTTRWSNHAYGAAIDFDAEHNGFNTGHGTMPQPVIDAFKRQGALWGGDYHGRTDPMHFEFCSRDGAPAKLLEVPVGDDAPHRADQDGDNGQGAVAPAAPSAGGFFGRMRNWVVGGAGGLGFTSLGFLTDWQIAVAFFVFVFVCAGSSISFVIWFFGKEPLRQWIVRHIA